MLQLLESAIVVPTYQQIINNYKLEWLCFVSKTLSTKTGDGLDLALQTSLPVL